MKETLFSIKKNLLIITLHADPAMPPGVGEWGGTHTYMRELLTELYDKNFNIILLTRKVYEDQKDIETISPSCKIVRLTLGEFGNFDKRNLFELHELTLQKTIQSLSKINFKPDIIHSVYWNSGHLAMRLSKIWKIPYVHSVISNGRGRNAHGAKGTAPNRIETEKKVFTDASFILCVAQSEKDELCEFYDIPSEKIIVAGQYVHPAFIYAAHNPYGFPRKSGIHYKIEPVYFSDSYPNESTISDWWNSKAFTYTGRMSLDKGVPYIVQAWHLLFQKYGTLCPALWLIGGSAHDIEKIRPMLGIPEETLYSLESSGKIVWWGYLDENGISSLYTRSLALITHSLYEPGGRVAVEAMCEGIPVLATPNGFALDSIRDWQNGFLIPYSDVQTLAIRMEHFVKQPYLSAIMGKQAKKISNVILLNWDFTGSHLAAYNAALTNKTTIPKKLYTYPFEEPISRKLYIYPYNQFLIDKADILQIMEKNQIYDIEFIEELHLPQCSSIVWHACTPNTEYYIKIPYDRINFFTLWSKPNEQPLVISAPKRYDAEIGSLEFHGIPPIIGKEEYLHAIIRKKYTSVTIPPNIMLDKAINKIQTFYNENSFDNLCGLEKCINNAIKKQNTYSAIDQLYVQLSTKQFDWQNYYIDYSLRAELLRWNAYFTELPLISKESVTKIFEISYDIVWQSASDESNMHFVINHGGCDLKNYIFTPEVVLLDNEKLHPGWPGIDFADLLISYVRLLNETETYELWSMLLNKIPTSIIPMNILTGWIILGTYKEAISDAACLKPVSQVLYERIKILLRFLS